MADVVTAQSLARIFNDCFLQTARTKVVTGASEPYYIPANKRASFSDGEAIAMSEVARIFSRSDYPASVMHEVAHWIIAGDERRTMIDYGYWYEPDGRSAKQQALFESVEVKPQALERILSTAAGMPFRLSADNANDPMSRPSEVFRTKVQLQTEQYLSDGLPERARIYCEALVKGLNGNTDYLKISSYLHQDLI